MTCAWVSPTWAKVATCEVAPVSFPYDIRRADGTWAGTRDFEMVLFRDTCEVRHLWTPNLSCEFAIGMSHWSRGMTCGQSLNAGWRVRAAGDQRSYFETSGEGARAITPSPAALKRVYDHLNDDDGAKPIGMDDFPKTFVSIGRQRQIANPDVQASMQSIRYRTMAGKDRLGISADAVFGCLKYQFGIILDRSQRGADAERQLHDAEKDMAAFLGDLRLEHVDDPIRLLDDRVTPLAHDRMLKPIMSCVPR